MSICRFLWAQKGPSMLHAVTMTLVGLKVALQKDWTPRDLVGGHNELVSPFLALELAYLVQVRLGVTYNGWRSFCESEKPSQTIY